MKRYLIIITLIGLTLFAPFTADAQTAACSPLTSSNYASCCNGVSPATSLGTMCSNYTQTINSTTGLQYTPQVTLQYGANSTFGGLSFNGVGAALVSCTGLGDALASVVTQAKNALGGLIKSGVSAVVNAVSGVPVLGSIVGGIGGLFGFGSKTPAPGSSASNPSYVQDTNLENKAGCLDGIAYVLSQQVLQQITNRTLHWANTGFGGNPLYIKDIDSYLGSIRNQDISTYLNGAQNSDPIFGNALKSVITQQVTGLNDGRAGVSLNTPQAVAYNSFMSDFTNGGWDALLNPANNPIGAFFNASDNLNQTISTQQQNSQNELQRNSGFLDMKTCVQYSTPPAPVANTNTAVANALSSQTPICLKYETVTPGSIVALQVSSITNSPQQQAQLATSFNEAVGSFFDSLLNQLFSRGLSGINGLANQADIGLSYGGIGSNTVTGTNGQTLPGVNANVASINSIAAANNTIDISRPQLLRAVLQTQYDYLNRSADSQAVLQRLVPDLGQLDYCFPGPNPSWQSNLSDNLTSYVTNATATQVSTDSTISNTNLSLYDKVSTNTVPVSDRSLSITGTGDAKGYIQNVNDSLTQEISSKFSVTALASDYAATTIGTANQNYAAGMATDIYNEISTLPAFAQNAAAADQQYGTKISTTQSDIQQLQAIDSQVLQIVSAAKTRYIAQQKAAGTPVNQQCLDAAYTIDTSAITGVARQESNTPSPIIQQLLDANKYFYSTL